jgi:hypothetical protein
MRELARGVRSIGHHAWCIGITALVACAPSPSTQPLGWGPLSPGMRMDTPRQHPAPRAQRSTHEPTEEGQTTPSTASTETKVAEQPAAEAPKPAASEAPKTEPPKGKVAPSAAAFVGEYTGEDVAVYHIESLPDRTEKDPKARMRVTSSSDTALAFELVDSSNGNEICTLTGTLGEAGVSIAKGQKCFEQSAEDASTSATVQSGTASVDQSRLLFDLDMSFVMEVAGRKLGGSLSYHFDGKRK